MVGDMHIGNSSYDPIDMIGIASGSHLLVDLLIKVQDHEQCLKAQKQVWQGNVNEEPRVLRCLVLLLHQFL